MAKFRPWIALLVILSTGALTHARSDPQVISDPAGDVSASRLFIIQSGTIDQERLDREQLVRQKTTEQQLPIVVRPAMIADQPALAGHLVKVIDARVVGVFDRRAFLVDSATLLRPTVGNRDRIMILIENGGLRVTPELLVSSTVTILGVARTLLGAQASADVPWPASVKREKIDRLEIRAAVLATSVQTGEGMELVEEDGKSGGGR